MRPVNMFVQALSEVDEGAECFPEIKAVIGAVYLAQFRNPNVYAFMANPTIPAYKGVDDPTSSLRRILRNMVSSGDFCQEMVNAARVDSDSEVAEALWEIVVSCTWDPSVLESVGTMRPYASQMKLIVKLTECESCRKLLIPVQMARCRRAAKVHSRTSVTSVLSRCALEYPDSSIRRVLSIARTRPPCELTRFVLDSYYSYLGVSMVNYALPDPVEIVVRPRDDEHVMVLARYEPPLSTGTDVTDTSTGYAWSCPGFSYNDMHTGRSRRGRDVTKVSKGIFDVTHPAYRSLPLESRTIHMARAMTVCLNAKGLPGEQLWEAELAMNGLFADEDTLLCMVKISPSVSTKRMTRVTQQTSHSVVAYPNASGCVLLSAPGASGQTGDQYLMTKVSDQRGKSLNVKAFHVVVKALTYIEASLSNRIELSIGYGIREGALRVLEDTIFTIDKEYLFNSAVLKLRDRVSDFRGNPFKDAMSYASAMGTRVGLVYDARDDDWDNEIGEDDIPRAEPEAPPMSTVTLPPLGLPPISSRRVPRGPEIDTLNQRAERDKVSESVVKKYDRVPPEERCHIRMKLDLLFTLTSHIVKLQPRVREILLSLNDNVAAIKKENMLLSESEVTALCNSMKKVISLANDTLKARNTNGMAETICGSTLRLEDAQLLSKVLNGIEDLELWRAVALYRMSHGRMTSPYMIVVNCHMNLTTYKRWLDSQGAFFVEEQAVSEMYRAASDVAKTSRTLRDFSVSVVKQLSKTHRWASKELSDAILAGIRTKVVHRNELEEIRNGTPAGRDNLLRGHWVEIVLGAMAAYGEVDVVADRVIEEMSVPSAKRARVSLDDLDLAVGSVNQGARVLNLGSDSKLESLRIACIAITQLGLDVENLIDLYMNEGHNAAKEAIQERRNPCYQKENEAYYLENHLNTWVEIFHINNPEDWDTDSKVLVLEELEGILSYEPIDQDALEAEDNE